MQNLLILKKVYVMSNIKLNIDNNILNIFSSNQIESILKELNLNNYYELKSYIKSLTVDGKYILI